MSMTQEIGVEMPKITEMYAFVTSDKQPEGKDEGVIGFLTPEGSWMPMVGADLDRVKSLIPIADKICKSQGITYRIYHFTNVRDITKEAKGEN
jgi:hypothetical protein